MLNCWFCYQTSAFMLKKKKRMGMVLQNQWLQQLQPFLGPAAAVQKNHMTLPPLIFIPPFPVHFPISFLLSAWLKGTVAWDFWSWNSFFRIYLQFCKKFSELYGDPEYRSITTYSVVQISWQIIGILPKRKWILAQVCLEAQHCEGFAEIRFGTCCGVKGLSSTLSLT